MMRALVVEDSSAWQQILMTLAQVEPATAEQLERLTPGDGLIRCVPAETCGVHTHGPNR